MFKSIAFSVFVMLVAAAAVAPVAAEERCSGCGCKGGPGYRGPKGCVGWAQLNKVCGTPPTTYCRPEGPALIALGKAAASKALGLVGAPSTGDAALAADGGNGAEAVASNQLKLKTQGIACVATETLKAMTSCPTRTPPADCSGERKTLVQNGACIELAEGAPVTVQAGSRSFDWLKIRVPGRSEQLWIERSFLLAR